MKKTSFIVMAIAFIASSASAMPMGGLHKASVIPFQAVEVKIICEQDGLCIKRGRKPVARWVYGEGAFYGPYNGPRYYGNPRYRYSWLPQWW
ncbi:MULTISPECIES: hypothetical protein [Bradyrhizobium]|uniref:Uncharacterized protein n=2 Tax=Bradyrhizobium TaxID=374 RepID=A0ABY0Q7K1_9BRAD|nr:MULTISPECIES: hypothetical protein [Bradyrhizobium]SDJ64952.1 hypothetical protein SAMN05444163_6040 [Bradyrhizobium ottawaense]SEC31429.1 hypothetical protein SAMN05444171_1120 [Bradyrhizobium lablabi]